MLSLLYLNVIHDLLINLLYVLFGCSKLLLQPIFFLLQGILCALGEFMNKVLHFIGHFSATHCINHVVTISVKLRWENFRHGLGGIGLINTSRLLNELGE